MGTIKNEKAALRERIAHTQNINMMYGYYFDNPPTRSSAKRTLGYSVPQIPRASVPAQTLNGKSQRFMRSSQYNNIKNHDIIGSAVADVISSRDIPDVPVSRETQPDILSFFRDYEKTSEKYFSGNSSSSVVHDADPPLNGYGYKNPAFLKVVNEDSRGHIYTDDEIRRLANESNKRKEARIKEFANKQNTPDSPLLLGSGKKAAQETAENAMKESDKLFSKLGKYTKIALGFGATAWLVNKLSDTRGQQTNAQLYGQQQYY